VTIAGTILQGPDLEPVAGRVVVEGGRIETVEIEAASDASALADDHAGLAAASTDRLVCPAFVNAHAHLGDSIVAEAGAGLDLEALVAPPDGLKHRRLRAADRADLVKGIRRSVRHARRTGTGAIADFREGGPEGVAILRDAVRSDDVPVLAFGRGDADVLATADGYGASGAADADFAAERAAAREAGKPFWIHAGEAGAHDIEPALDLEPDGLVHMNQATDAHLDRAGAAGVPIAVCPRSNLITGAGLPPAARIAERTTLALGTDNVMLNSPSMFRELAFLTKCTDVDARTALRAATVNGARALGLDRGPVEAGRPAALLVLDGGSDNLAGTDDIHRAIVRRAGPRDVERVVLPG